MPPRASWTGHLRLSLVSFPIRLYNATTTSSRVSFNQLHKDCNQRLKQQMICPQHGPVERSDIVKGYEYEKDRYVLMDEADLTRVKIETNKVIEVTQFIDAGELDAVYLDSPYYMAPDGPVAEEAFRVIREALRKSRKIGIARIVLASREYVCALRVQEKGFVLTTLRYPGEVRQAEPYFEDIKNGDLGKEQLALAEQLIDGLAAPFDASKFNDRYQDALLEIIKAKIAGTEPVVVQEAEVGKVINLMEALKASVSQAVGKKPPAKSVKAAAAAKPQKKAKGA